MSAVEELERRLLELPEKDRASLAAVLLNSLPSADDDLTEAEEMAEVERRELEIESGSVSPLTAAEFWRRIEATRK